MTPLNRRRVVTFRASRRGMVSLLVFGVLFFVTLFAELLANDRPLLIYYDGAIYSPTADRFLLASRYFRGPAFTVISGDGKFVTNVGPTDANSHQVAFDAATNTIFTIMIPKGTPSLAAFALPR